VTRNVTPEPAPDSPRGSLAWSGSRPRHGRRARVASSGSAWAADRQPHDAIVEWAGNSAEQTLSGRHFRRARARARARGCDHPHAVRILARAWDDGARGSGGEPNHLQPGETTGSIVSFL
jgi:hypothetical protein